MSVAALATQMHKVPAGYAAKTIVDDTGSSITAVAGITGQSIDVWGFMLSANGTVDVNFKSNATTMSGSIAMAAGTPIVIPPPQGDVGRDFATPLFTTKDGDPLVITGNGTQRLSGIVWYVQRPTSLL